MDQLNTAPMIPMRGSRSSSQRGQVGRHHGQRGGMEKPGPKAASRTGTRVVKTEVLAAAAACENPGGFECRLSAVE